MRCDLNHPLFPEAEQGNFSAATDFPQKSEADSAGVLSVFWPGG